LRIEIVAHAFPPYTGGLAYVAENLSVNLARKGFEVEVLTLDVGKGLPRYEEYKGVHVRRFRGYAPDNCYFIPSTEFIGYLKDVRADIVHVHNIGSLLTPIAIQIARENKSRPKIVVTPHHHESGSKWHTKVAWLFYKPIARQSLSRVDVIHAVSRYEASLIMRDFGREAVIIPNGVSEDVFKYRWRPPEDRIVLTYAGRVERYKRVDLVVRLAKELSRLGVDVVVRVIGEGPDLQRVLRIAINSGVRFEAPGFLPRETYLEMLSQSTALVNFSDYEAYSIVTAEALAMGVPAIIARPWGNIFEGVTGAYIVDKQDISGIANLIIGIHSNTARHHGRVDWNERIQPWSHVAEQIVQRLYLR
jgi:glycosyltransferase involved in cell wall biosynthesis